MLLISVLVLISNDILIHDFQHFGHIKNQESLIKEKQVYDMIY